MYDRTKEKCALIVEKYWEREWEKIKQIPFPKTREYEITFEQCVNEVLSLAREIKNNKTASKCIIKFHSSLCLANRKGCLSPFEYWQFLKVNEEEFKKFYENRLRCSDWFKEKNYRNFHNFEVGFVPEFIYGIGMSTSRKAPFVSYFKPSLAKNLILKYLPFDVIFDPCAGYSGRMIGALCSNKKYIGYDINDITVNESNNLFNSISPYIKGDVTILNKDSLKEEGTFDCLFTCTPYKDKETWLSSKGEIKSNYTCDEWIDLLIERYNCKKYLFIVDETTKYKNNIVETLENRSHFNSNKEYVIEIQK